MKTVYCLKLRERDDYFRSHDTLVCEILEIDENDKQVIEDVRYINGNETKRIITTKLMINGKYRNVSSGWEEEYFDSLEDLKKYLEAEFVLARSSKHDFLLLAVDDSYNSVVAITNYKGSSCICSAGFVNLQELIGLNFLEAEKS